MYVMGLDVGTQGARAIVLNEHGVCFANSREIFSPEVTILDLPEGWYEQDARAWIAALDRVVRKTLADLAEVGVSPREIGAVACTSTSGTVVPLDKDGDPLSNAIMYNDLRSTTEAAEINAAGSGHCSRHGYLTNASFSLPKLLWLVRHRPEIVDRAAHLAHATDLMVGWLTGQWGLSDFSNALKSCYDLIELRWPDFIGRLGVPLDKLPHVESPGAVLLPLRREIAERFGFSRETKVAAGCTDGTAGFLASGAGRVGEACTTIGTTLVMRVVSSDIVRDPSGRLYSHRHPDGLWLPGGASSVGAECFGAWIPGCDHDVLARKAEPLLPTDAICYPLVRRGERFPFLDPHATAFCLPELDNPVERYAACLQGVSFVERWCYEVMEDLGCRSDGAVHTVGAGARNATWCQMRADLLRRTIVLPRMSDPAVGAAILAARALGLKEAQKEMVGIRDEFAPNLRRAMHFDRLYGEFRAECRRRGYGVSSAD